MLLLSCELLAANRLELCNAAYARGRRRVCPAYLVPALEPGRYATTRYCGLQSEMQPGRKFKSTWRVLEARSITTPCKGERPGNGYGNLKRKLRCSGRKLWPVLSPPPILLAGPVDLRGCPAYDTFVKIPSGYKLLRRKTQNDDSYLRMR